MQDQHQSSGVFQKPWDFGAVAGKNMTRRGVKKLATPNNRRPKNCTSAFLYCTGSRLCVDAHVCSNPDTAQHSGTLPLSNQRHPDVFDGSVLTALGSAHATIMCGGSSQYTYSSQLTQTLQINTCTLHQTQQTNIVLGTTHIMCSHPDFAMFSARSVVAQLNAYSIS